MTHCYFNGSYLLKEEIRISPDDRGFLFADGIYEVVRWYDGFFYDMNSHVTRLKRSLKELTISWSDVEKFPDIAGELIEKNNLGNRNAMVYLQVTRGVAKRTHYFPSQDTLPTVYSYAWGFNPDQKSKETGIRVLLKDDIRWSRCDIKSIALLPNTLSYQEAHEQGLNECIFVREGLITEGSHSNIFFVDDNTLITHPESNFILSGITRKNILRIAQQAGISIREEALRAERLGVIQEAFISNTSSEVTPVTEIGGNHVGQGVPGLVTRLISKNFDAELRAIKG